MSNPNRFTHDDKIGQFVVHLDRDEVGIIAKGIGKLDAMHRTKDYIRTLTYDFLAAMRLVAWTEHIYLQWATMVDIEQMLDIIGMVEIKFRASRKGEGSVLIFTAVDDKINLDTLLSLVATHEYGTEEFDLIARMLNATVYNAIIESQVWRWHLPTEEDKENAN